MPADVVADRREKRKLVDVSLIAGESSCPLKKLRVDEEAGPRSAVAGKSLVIVQSLLHGSMLECERGVDPLPFIHFVSSSVSATPERDADAQGEDSVEGQRRCIGPVERLVLSSHSSPSYSGHGTEADSLSRPEALVTLAGTITAPSSVPESPSRERKEKGKKKKKKEDVPEGPYGKIRIVRGMGYRQLQEKCVADWAVTYGTLSTESECREMLDGFAPPQAFAYFRNMHFDQFLDEFNVNSARKAAFCSSLRLRTEHLAA